MANIEYKLGKIGEIDVLGRFTYMVYSPVQKKVTIYYDVIPVDDEGNEMVSPIVKPYQAQNIADNTTIVNLADGSFVDTQADGYKFDPATMCGQYDFFENIAANVPVKINDMILQYLQLASEMGTYLPK